MLFSWHRALFGRYDVFHVHWPERLTRGAGRLATAAKRMRFSALLLRWRLAPVAIVRTLHNVAAHEPGDRVEGLLLRAFDRLTTLYVRLNPFTEIPEGVPASTIVHGHYRDWFGPTAAEPIPGRLLYFGLLRPYKGVEDLLGAFSEVDDARVSLRLVGGAQDPKLARMVTDAGRSDPRVTSRLAYVSDEELGHEVAMAELVVLPYRAVHNSGAAILALSLGRPVLMPETQTTTWLRDEVGDWLQTYDGELTGQVLVRAMSGLPTGDPPRLQTRDWPPIARDHLAAYRRAASVRGQSRRYST